MGRCAPILRPMTAARRNDPEASRNAILDAAEALFLERGFAGASMSEIAKASGVTKSLIHHHYGTKEALWTEVKRCRFMPYYDRQIHLLTQMAPSAEMVRESMSIYFQFLRDTPQMLRITWWMLLEGDDGKGEMADELRALGVARIRQAQERGQLRRDIDPCHILLAFAGLVQAWFSDPRMVQMFEVAPAAYLESAWKIFASGVVPHANC